MRVLDVFKFFDAVSTAKTCDNDFVNACSGGQMIVQVSGTATDMNIVFKGVADPQNGEWTTLGVINMSDYSIESAITANGIYCISTDGISKVRSQITSISGGNVTVLGKIGD